MRTMLVQFFENRKGGIARRVAELYGKKVKKVAINYIGADGQVYS